MEINSVTFSKLLLDTKDGDWGKSEACQGFLPYRVIRGTDFADTNSGNLSNIPIRYLAESSAQRRTLQPDDIIIETAGGSNDRPTGRTLLVKRKLIEDSDLPLTCASFCRFLRVNPKLAAPRYIYWYLQYLYAKGEMWIHQVKHTGIARFQYTRFASTVQVPLPSAFEQQAIAHILGSLDDKIELNRQMNETLESIARTLFKSWFVDFDPVRAKMEGRQPYGMDAETAALFPDGFEDSMLGEIPRGWDVGKIADITDNLRLSVQPEEIKPTTPYIGLEHMPRKSIALSEWDYADKVASNKYRFLEGNILFGKLRPYFHKVGIAIQHGVCSTDILVIMAKVPKWFCLSLFYLSSDELIDYADAVSTGTKMPRTSWDDIARYSIIIPSPNVAEKFNAITLPFVQRIRANIFESQTLATLRDTLLPKLLSGEIRVKDAEKEVGAVM